MLAEPSPRDSMAAIGLAAAVLERRDPDGGDRLLRRRPRDRRRRGRSAEAVRVAAEVAARGWLVTLGIVPTHASTASATSTSVEELPGHAGAHAVAEFVEKPAADVAERYVAIGALPLERRHVRGPPRGAAGPARAAAPGFAARLREIAADPTLLDALWPTLPRIAIDHAVAEPAAAAGRVAVVPAAFGWDDIGDFDSLAALLGAGRRARWPCSATRDGCEAVDSSGLVVPGTGRVVAVVGLDDVVVVDTPDALLVTSRARAQDVKEIVDALGGGWSRPDLTERPARPAAGQIAFGSGESM